MLGPVTTLASVIQRHPALVANITRVVAVAGRRKDAVFTPFNGEENKSDDVFSFPDLNFESDTQAFQVLLDHHVPLTLAPWELSSKVWLTHVHIDRMGSSEQESFLLSKGAKGSATEGVGAMAENDTLVAAAKRWLDFWENTFHIHLGFNPFDSLAISAVTHPEQIQCEVGTVTIMRLNRDGEGGIGDTQQQHQHDLGDENHEQQLATPQTGVCSENTTGDTSDADDNWQLVFTPNGVVTSLVDDSVSDPERQPLETHDGLDAQQDSSVYTIEYCYGLIIPPEDYADRLINLLVS